MPGEAQVRAQAQGEGEGEGEGDIGDFVEAASSSTRSTGWVVSGTASSWESQACPEEAQEPSRGTAQTER